MKILNVEKRSRNQYQIKLTDQRVITTYDTVMLKHKLILKKELSEDLIEEIQKETVRASLYDQALHYLGKKKRSLKEMRSFLSEKGADVTEIEQLIIELTEKGWMNERAYIEAYVHDRLCLSDDGPTKIKRYLLQQEISESMIVQELDLIKQTELEERMRRVISKKYARNQRYSDAYWHQKVLNEMYQLGYSTQMVETVLNTFTVDHTHSLKADASRLYRKYASKNTSTERYRILKQKLYQKQYPMEEIELVLDALFEENSQEY